MSTLMPERVTPQQEERIRELRAENWFLDNPHNEVNEAVDDLFLLLDEARAELETERMRNVACGVAALGNTEKTRAERIRKDNPYYSASYADVCAAVDREMALRQERDRLAEQVRVLKEAVQVSCITSRLCRFSGPCRFCRALAACERIERGEG